MDRKYFDAIKAGLEQMQEACAGKKKMTEAEQEPTEPGSDKEKKLAALAEPKDKITHADVLKGRGVTKEETEIEEEAEQSGVSEIIEKMNDFEIEVKESYTFAEYLDAAKTMVAEDQVVGAADAAYRAQNTEFMLESFVRADIESKVAAHKNAGNKVSSVSYSTKGGQPYAEYTVTDKEGTSRRYIHHGNTRKVENLGS